MFLLAQLALAAEPKAAMKPVKECVLVEPDAISASSVAGWKKEGFSAVAVMLEERFNAKVYESAATAMRGGTLDLYYWIEVARNPRMASEHPEWMASLGMHADWLQRFPNAEAPGDEAVAKAFPWVSIYYREAFNAHLERIEELLKRIAVDYRGILLNDLQGGPSSCGCGNLQCRWATDYHVPPTGAKFGADDPAARFVGAVQQKVGSREVIPVWMTECEEEDLPKAKRAGQWTTGYCGTVGCAVGTCPRAFTQQFTALTRAHRGNIGILALHRELGRVFSEYGGTTRWVGRAVDYLDRIVPQNGEEPIPHDRLWLIVQAYGVSRAEENAARHAAAKTGAGAVVVARTRLNQSYEPRVVSVKK